MEKSTRIEEFYSEVIKAFVENVSVENKESFAEAYRKYLHIHYDEYFEEIEESGFDNIAMMCVSREKVTNIAKKELDKQALLFPDEAYLALENISLKIGHLARLKKCGSKISISKSQDEYTDILKQHFNNVSDLFRYTAERMLSEAILDLQYIFDESPSRSFRT